jgi:hypothetical protein
MAALSSKLRSLIRVFQQCHEPGLLEVMIAGQCFGNAFALHDDEGDAIGKRPFLVGTGCIQLNSGFIESRVERHDEHIASRQQLLARLHKHVSLPRGS